MDIQKILDKLAVIRENVKGFKNEFKGFSVYNLNFDTELDNIESQIMSLMNEISEPEYEFKYIKKVEALEIFAKTVGVSFTSFAKKIEVLEENVDKLLLRGTIKDTEDWESLVKEYGIVERTNAVEKDIKSLKEKNKSLEDKCDVVMTLFKKGVVTLTNNINILRKRVKVLKEKTIGITNENYLKRGIKLSGVRNIVKEFLEIIEGGNTPSDFAFKQWLEMLEENKDGNRMEG